MSSNLKGLTFGLAMRPSDRKSTRKGIVLLVTQLERAGAQQVAMLLARHFCSGEQRTVLCFFYDKGGYADDFLRTEPFEVINLGYRREGAAWAPRRWLSFLRSLWTLFRLLREVKPVAILTLTHFSNIIGIPIAWLGRVPIRLASQRNVLHNFHSRFLALDGWLVNSQLTDRMVAVSDEVARFCIEREGMRPEKLIVIPNGIDADGFTRRTDASDELAAFRRSLGIASGKPVITTVARLHPQKGHRYLIQAALEVTIRLPEVLFLLVGDGAERDNILGKIKDSELEANFMLTGVRADIPAILSVTDIFVMPSLYEGMPNAILEAMAAEVPVVATGVGGVPEIVAHTETGLLVPSANSEALAEAIVIIEGDNKLARSMGEKGRRRVVTHFSKEVMCARYEKLLSSVLDHKMSVGKDR